MSIRCNAFFQSLRERPVFAWERYQMRDVW